MKLHNRLLLALLAGLAFGTVAHAFGDAGWLRGLNTYVFRPVGQLFLRTILMIVVPLVFSGLVLGVFDLARSRGLGTVVTRTLAFTVFLSSLSVMIGMTLVNLVRPGESERLRLLVPQLTSTAAAPPEAAGPVSFPDALVELVPRNPLEAAVGALDGQMLPLMIFALVLGAALSLAVPDRREDIRFVRMLDELFRACMWIVHLAMRFAPVAVFAIVFGTAMVFGPSLLAPLLLYVLTVVAGLLVQQFVVYAAMLRLIARRPAWPFFRAAREVYLYAFSTASSNATLPLSLDVAERKLGLSPEVARFTLTVGSTANQNGTALFEGVTVLFLAQVYALDLTAGQQLQVLVMSIVAGIGTAGIPGGSLPMVMLLAQSVGVPAEGLGLILGVDRFLDMCRTAVNVSGDLVIGALVDTSERTTTAPGATIAV